MAVHRIDLHKELLRLALDAEGVGQPAVLKLDAAVMKAYPEEGRIELADGTVRLVDLVVAADGLHSIVRNAALQREAAPANSGLSAFRFLLDQLRNYWRNGKCPV